MSALIPGKTITYEKAYKIFLDTLGIKNIGDKMKTISEIAKKHKVSANTVKEIKSCTFLESETKNSKAQDEWIF